MAEGEKTHHFEVRVAWDGDATGSGEVRVNDGAFPVPIAGATSLGGAGVAANPEELLLAALGSCFINTWAIFLKKLAVGYGEPTLRVSGELGPDPAGGFRMQSAVVHARVPASLMSAGRPQIEKTLQLAEKYCIVSKVVRASMSLAVQVEEV
jgi:organic hydroperoxide reductase OsmC/OhrA